MSTERERLKSRIMAEVEVLVEQALAQGEKHLTLSQIEELALAARSEMSQELTSGLLEQQASGTRSELPACPNCGQQMRPKGQKQRYLRTRSGDVRLQRPYFYCPHCRRGYFPPG
jgi:YgiT-type zinc finger domain-containing protein